MEPRASWQAAFIFLTFTYLVCAHECVMVCTWIAEDCLPETPTVDGPQGSNSFQQVGQPVPSALFLTQSPNAALLPQPPEYWDHQIKVDN